ncbi:MAG TPA: hypothetical protein VK207_03275 [Bacteroidales bacterium]|nr:hypothetical protein [Bacteroidales bacterium]
MEDLEDRLIYHGGHDSNDKQINLKAGPLSVIYENGNLRHITADGHELVRMIYMAVRDREWLTVKPEISGEEFGIYPDSFQIKYVACYSFGDIRFFARFRIEGKTDGSLVCRFEGKSLSDFEKNRIGFCVLHPIKEIAGTDCIIENPDNEIHIGKFPDHISPHQPFRNISMMHWNVNGISCRLEFSGDVFETEDQRNWTDASFKTYSTPLTIPYPAPVKKGDHINQKVIFRLKGSDPNPPKGKKNLITVNPGETTSFPFTGIGRSTRHEPFTETEIRILKSLKFDHYRTDLYLFEPGWQVIAGKASDEASALGYSLELALFFDDDYLVQSEDFITWYSHVKPGVSCVILLYKESKVTPDKLTEEIAPIFKRDLPEVILAAGTNSNFAQINRTKPDTRLVDALCYAIHPQEHADDNLTLTENLEGQMYTVQSARDFPGNKAVRISPVNIIRRFNANSENYEKPAKSEGRPFQVDSRMMSLFGACWTAISMKYLAEAGTQAITWHQTVGERGIMQGDYPSRWPDEFRAAKGAIFPLFHFFQFILKSKKLRVAGCRSSDPLAFDALALTDGTKLKMVLANFTPKRQEANFEGTGESMTIRQLNAHNYREAASDPLWLLNLKGSKLVKNEKVIMEPYSISFIESIL